LLCKFAGTSNKIKNQARSLFRPKAIIFCHQKPNPTRETVPLKRKKGLMTLAVTFDLKVHKIEIFFGFDFEICIISLLVM
jgi:hypothetical protein